MTWWEPFAEAWKWYQANRVDLTPIGALLGGAAIAWAALRQARSAARQADIAARRHDAQTEADRQRRITESFSKAVEQLGSDKIETRLGGIYTLERITHESAADYWTVMETLTAFVRERAQWKERASWKAPSTQAYPCPPATDIAAVLSVIVRRDDKNRDREKCNHWRLNLSKSDLRRAVLFRAHLEGANLLEVHLEGAGLIEVHLEGAHLSTAHLEGARLFGVHLENAALRGTHFEGANLQETHLEGAKLRYAHLEGADLKGAHLNGADPPSSAS